MLTIIPNYQPNFGKREAFKQLFKVCAYSGEPFDSNGLENRQTIEHIISKAKGGKNDIRNMLVVKKKWNFLKDKMSLRDFIKIYPHVEANIANAVKSLEGVIIYGISWAEEIKKTLLQEIGRDIFKT